MDNSQNNLNNLIIKAIDASIEFDKVMDCIDFISYLPEDKHNDDIKYSSLYENYIKMCEAALNICKDIIQEIEKKKSNNIKPMSKNKKVYSLIGNLFEAKKTRVEARNQERIKEVKLYTENTFKLHKAFLQIPKKNWSYSEKDKNLLDDYNWAKILYYNELAICYSGLIKSSMSLGYAEESIRILEKLYNELKFIEIPAEKREKSSFENFEKRFQNKKNLFAPSHIMKLYTFALYNKGEAERMLHDTDPALKTFKRIVKIYEKCKDERKESYTNLSDYNSALLHKAQILNDQGRGEESINCLKAVKLDEISNYYVRVKLEKASALIDQKEYKNAWKLLVKCTGEDFKNTFTQRQARIHQLRLINEFKKNMPKGYDSNDKSPEVKEIKPKFPDFLA